MQSVGSHEIKNKMAALDRALSDFNADADEISIVAVAGDPDAGKKLAEVNARIERAKADRVVLSRAYKKAVEAEAEAFARSKDEAREQHIAQARLNAVAVVKAARFIDALSADFAAAMADLSKAEAAVLSSLSAARSLPDEGVVGRRNIGRFAVERLMKVIDPRMKFNPADRGVEAVAENAWRYLIATETMEAA